LIYGDEVGEGDRARYVREFGCARWTEGALATLASLGPILELGTASPLVLNLRRSRGRAVAEGSERARGGLPGVRRRVDTATPFV
jgi:hypothetical protein